MVIGEYLGPYKIEKRLGFGGMGEVYLAHDPALERDVAIKIIVGSYGDDIDALKRFQQEARAAARLSHPNIVQVHAVNMDATPPFMVMEYVAGQSLEELLRTEGSLPWPRAVDIAGQVTMALACAHDAGIIHRDIKPGNILIDPSGRARVTDFGIARVLSAQTRLTLEPSSIGSPAYMSPEQCRGQDVTPASDLFALGVTLFEMLAGRLPFEAENAMGVAHKIATEPLPSISEFVQGVPPILQAVLEVLTVKDPARRYGTAGYLIEDLVAVRNGQPPKHASGLKGVALVVAEQAQVPQAVPPAAVPQPGRPQRPNLVDDLLLEDEGSAFRKAPVVMPRSINWTPLIWASGVVLAMAVVGLLLALLVQGSPQTAPPSPEAAEAAQPPQPGQHPYPPPQPGQQPYPPPQPGQHPYPPSPQTGQNPGPPRSQPHHWVTVTGADGQQQNVRVPGPPPHHRGQGPGRPPPQPQQQR